jgi:hypothetical protein
MCVRQFEELTYAHGRMQCVYWRAKGTHGDIHTTLVKGAYGRVHTLVCARPCAVFVQIVHTMRMAVHTLCRAGLALGRTYS